MYICMIFMISPSPSPPPVIGDTLWQKRRYIPKYNLKGRWAYVFQGIPQNPNLNLEKFLAITKNIPKLRCVITIQ